MPEVLTRTEPASDGSQKYLFRLADGNRIESVFMPMGDRTSICLSSQAGCAVGCTFCVTGFFGAGRNLTPAEMLGQFFTIQREKQIPMEQMNVVFMGMGEPLLNFDNLVTTLEMLYTQHRAAPRHRLDVGDHSRHRGAGASSSAGRTWRSPSTRPTASGARRSCRSRRSIRSSELMAVAAPLPAGEGTRHHHRVRPARGLQRLAADAVALAKLIRGLHAKVNAIPFNEDANLPQWMKRPSDREIDRFVDTLVRNGVRVTVRRSKGRDIAAACGQLRGQGSGEEPRYPRTPSAYSIGIRIRSGLAALSFVSIARQTSASSVTVRQPSRKNPTSG